MDSLVPQFSAFQVALLLFMEYVDLGKWVAAIEGGSCFGLGLLLLLFYNCTAVLLQCLASYISLVTGKDLAQVCSEHYSRLSFVLLGTAIELSMIASDVTKILSVAYGFHVLFEMDLFTCISLASIVSVALPVFVFSLGYHNLKVLHVSIAIFSSLFYVLGVHLTQLETSFSPHKAYSGVNLKNAHSVMALLGAQIVPHNFYIQPYIIQLQRKQLDASMRVVLQTHLFTFLSIFASMFLLNSMMMNLAASVFNSYGFLPTFQDAFLLMNQDWFNQTALLVSFLYVATFVHAFSSVPDIKTIHKIFRSPAAAFLFCLFFLLSSLVASITHGCVGRVIVYHFFLIKPPVWVLHIIAKVFAVSVALYFTQGAGSEGIYQLLVFCQVITAILLLPSVIPLFQLSSSRSTMGAFGISPLVEFLYVVGFTGMLLTNVIFITELVFGNNGIPVDLWLNMENDFPGLYSFVILLALASLFFALYLFFTPLRPSINEPHVKISTEELQKVQAKQSQPAEENGSVEVSDNGYRNTIGKLIHQNSLDLETKINSEEGCHKSDPVPNPSTAYTSYLIQSNGVNLLLKRVVPPEDDQPISSSGPQDLSHISGSKDSGSNKSMIIGSGKEATSEFGRGSKRQLAAILDEFWGLLFDYHGKLTKEAKSIRADILLGLDCDPHPTCGLETESKLKLKSNEAVSLAVVDDSESNNCLILSHEKFWSKNNSVPSVNFVEVDKNIYCPYETLTWGGKIIHSTSGASKKFLTYGESERLVLQSLRLCIRKLLRLNSSGWLFSQNGGLDEELIDYLAMSEGLLHKDESFEEQEELIVFLPNISYCGKGCIWQASLVVSFGVWCIRRILELLLTECRPEIWGKYTYVLNRLQGIIDPVFCKPRNNLSPCKCLEACSYYNRENSGTLKITSRSSVLQLVKGAETYISARKGRAGTAAANIAFPKGKENIISVLKRYKHRLSKISP